MKITALVLGLALVVGCGGAPDRSVEARTDQLAIASLTAYNVACPVCAVTREKSFIQQVPYSTAFDACPPPVAGHEFNPACGTGIVFDSPTYRLDLTRDIASGRYSIAIYPPHATNGGNGVECSSTMYIGPQNYHNWVELYFPSDWTHFPNTPVNVSFVGASTGVGLAGCVQASGGWIKSFTAGLYTWSPNKTATGANQVPSANTTRMYVRMDVPFPEYGVTNRYFWSFTR